MMRELIQKKLNTCKSSQLFAGLTESEISELAVFGQLINITAGAYIIHEKENKHYLFLVVSGELKAEIQGEPDVIYKTGHYFGEIAFVNEHYRAASVAANTDSELIAFDHTLLQREEANPVVLKKLLINIVGQISTYLRTHRNTSSQLLIREGENESIEFKSSLRYNLHTEKFDKNIENASLKTIAAFLNSEGGTLLIGVEDNGHIFGLEKDRFANEDKAMLHLTSLIKSKISMQHLTFIRIMVEEVGGRQIMRVDVSPANIPAYVKGNNDEIFYIRTGPSTSQLRVSEIFSYISKRFDLA